VAKKKNIANTQDMLADLVRKRVILNLNQDAAALPKVISTLKALKSGGISVKALLVDDIDFSRVKPEEISEIHEFAKAEGIAVWMSSAFEKAEDVPAEKAAPFDTVLHLAPTGSGPELQILSSHGKNAAGAKLHLDSKTFLITDK
jgi:hypothetical protein